MFQGTNERTLKLDVKSLLRFANVNGLDVALRLTGMATKNISVFGIFGNELDTADCIDELRSAGFRNTDVSILYSENAGNKDLAHEKSTKAPEGAALGASSGAVVGGALGWLAGIGALAIPGLGPFVAAGPIMALLSGIGVGGAFGGVTGALIGAGMPEYEAKRYEGRIRRGGVLLSVHCDNSEWEKTAKDILSRTGAQDISSTSEAKADFGATEVPRPRTPA
jgi:hypothetical protein